jgi:hypothetical protein
MTLLETTQQLLRERIAAGMKLREIVRASGGTVEREWLYRFARGEIESPGVKPIQSLHDCLASLVKRDAA